MEKAALLMGTMDELGILKEGEVFVQVDRGSMHEEAYIITGPVVVTKNPALTPRGREKAQCELYYL